MEMAGCNAAVAISIGVYMEPLDCCLSAMEPSCYSTAHRGFIMVIPGESPVAPKIATKPFSKAPNAKPTKNWESIPTL